MRIEARSRKVVAVLTAEERGWWAGEGQRYAAFRVSVKRALRVAAKRPALIACEVEGPDGRTIAQVPTSYDVAVRAFL